MSHFNERAFLIKALVAIFAVQLAVAGYQIISCRAALTSKEAEPNFVAFCTKSNDNFSEMSKSAANVFLALLVPAAAMGVVASRSKAKTTSKNTSPSENTENTEG